MTRNHLVKQLVKFLKSDRGSVEAAMVIVPLAILFLAGMQIAVTSHLRNVEKIHVQDSASTRAITGRFHDSDRFIHIESSGDGQNLDLLIAHQERSIPLLIPTLSEILGRSPQIAVDGLAIVENRR